MKKQFQRDMTSVPIEACRFEVSDVTVESNGEEAKSAKFEMVARSSSPIDHPFWGRIVHDMSGMQLNDKARVTIDYNHDEPIGYANKFEVQEDGLHASGALLMSDERSREIVEKANFGIPWEASINFGGSGIKLEFVDKESTAQVNGYEFAGPGVVVREWPLRGIAVCPYGADQFTSTEFSADKQVAVTCEESTMSKVNPFELNEKQVDEILDKEKHAEEASGTSEDVEATEDAVEASADVDKDAEAETAESAVEASALGQADHPASVYMEHFGEQDGALFFAKGVPLLQAALLHAKARDERITDLEQRLSKISQRGESEPLDFSEHTPPKEKHSPLKLPKQLTG